MNWLIRVKLQEFINSGTFRNLFYIDERKNIVFNEKVSIIATKLGWLCRESVSLQRHRQNRSNSHTPQHLIRSKSRSMMRKHVNFCAKMTISHISDHRTHISSVRMETCPVNLAIALFRSWITRGVPQLLPFANCEKTQITWSYRRNGTTRCSRVTAIHARRLAAFIKPVVPSHILSVCRRPWCCTRRPSTI